jgi:serine/threonine-protein kinase RsbT
VFVDEITLEIQEEGHIVGARQAGRNMARELGFGSADQTRLATAISELARNVVQYAGTGVCVISDQSDDTMLRVRVVIDDRGPGIPDIEQAMQDGFTTGEGMGLGLPDTRRLAQEFDIQSDPGNTRVAVTIARLRGGPGQS